MLPHTNHLEFVLPHTNHLFNMCCPKPSHLTVVVDTGADFRYGGVSLEVLKAPLLIAFPVATVCITAIAQVFARAFGQHFVYQFL